MAIDFTKAAEQAATATAFQVGGGGAPVTEGDYIVKVTEVKQAKTQNNFPQVHVVCVVESINECNTFDDSYPETKIGDTFDAKFNVGTDTEKLEKAATQNVQQLFALAIWNGLQVSTFNEAKLKTNFAKEFCYHVADALETSPWIVGVKRVRGNAAAKGHYWNHAFYKVNENAAKGADSVPQADEEESLA